MHCRMSSSTLSLYTLEANSTTSLSVTTKCLRMPPNVPWGDEITFHGEPLVQVVEGKERVPCTSAIPFRFSPVPMPDPMGVWMSNSMSVFLSLQKVLERRGEL